MDRQPWPQDMTWPTPRDVIISPYGEVRPGMWLGAMVRGEALGRIILEGPDVWISEDGVGGVAGSRDEALQQLIDEAMSAEGYIRPGASAATHELVAA